jgi:hypothetical protein
VLLKAMHFLWAGNLQNRASKPFSSLKAIRMRHKCEALWHSCNSPLEVHSLKTRGQYEQLVRLIRAKTEWLRFKRIQRRRYETSKHLKRYSMFHATLFIRE